MNYEVLRLEHIGRSVNDHIVNTISFSLLRGEALCVITEDIDTKHFLLELLQGLTQADHGTLYLFDHAVRLHSLEHTQHLGLYFASEDFLISSMNVAHNLYITDSTFYNSLSFLNKRSMYNATAKLLKLFSLEHIKTNAIVNTLSQVDIFLLSILHAYVCGAKIIVLDNPYYHLYHPDEIKLIQHVVSILKQQQVSVLWFSSKWDVIFQNFDKYAVVQEGVVTQLSPLTTIPPDLPANHMLSSRMYKQNLNERTAILECKNFPFLHHNKKHSFSFSLYDSEILGLCDTHNALSPHMNLIVEERFPQHDVFFLSGQPFRPGLERKNQIAFISGNVSQERIFPQMTLFDNVTLLLNKPMYNHLGIMNKRIRNHIAKTSLTSIHAEHLIQEYGNCRNIKSMPPQDQFLVEIAKWLCLKPKVFIFIQPHEIYANLSEYHFQKLLGILHELGAAILIVSASEESLSKLCTRIEKVT